MVFQCTAIKPQFITIDSLPTPFIIDNIGTTEMNHLGIRHPRYIMELVIFSICFIVFRFLPIAFQTNITIL